MILILHRLFDIKITAVSGLFFEQVFERRSFRLGLGRDI